MPPERVHQLVAELEKLIDTDLAYPAIAAPIATGIIDASAYLALDFVAADSLDVVVRNSGPARPAEVLRIVGQLAGALDFAADVQIEHGALHPRDVLIAADDVRVTGLGIARALERAGHPLAARRPYSAPERIAGAPWTRTADVFSLGALTFELITGRRVAGTGAQAASALGEVADVDREALTGLMARALAERPADRPARPGDFADALHDVLAAAPVASRLARKRRKAPDDPPLVRHAAPALPLAIDEPLAADPADDLAPFADSQPIDVVSRDESAAAAPRRVDDVDEMALRHPLVPEHEETIRFVEPPAPPSIASARVEDVDDDAVPLSALERSRSAIWPLGLALMVGVAIGFGIALAMLGRDHGGTEIADAVAAPVGAVGTTSSVAPTEVSEPPLRPPSENVRPAAAAPVSATAPPPPASATAVAPSATVPPPARRAPAPPTLGRIQVRTDPAGARVFLDGASRGVTPATLSDVKPGAHTVRITHDGYRSVERRVTITESRTSQSLQIELARASAPAAERRPAPPAAPAPAGPGSLVVDSRPAGARVLLDGRPVGQTPVTLRSVTAGEHTVQMELDGFRRWSSTVKVAAGEQSKVAGSLER